MLEIIGSSRYHQFQEPFDVRKNVFGLFTTRVVRSSVHKYLFMGMNQLESNFLHQKFFTPNFFYVKIYLSQKNAFFYAKTSFTAKNAFFTPTNFFYVKKHFFRQNFFTQNFFPPKLFYPKFFSAKKFFYDKKTFFTPKKHFFTPKIFRKRI